MSFTTSIFKRKKSMHKWVISIKVLRAVWKVNTRVYSQLYLRQTTTNFQLIVDNIPVVVSNSCLKRKKSRSWLVTQIKSGRQCLWPVSQLKTNQKQIQMKMITLIKEYPLHSRCDAGCSRCVDIHSYIHTHTHTCSHTVTHFFPN